MKSKMMAADQSHRWQGELSFNEPMGQHSSWRTGGCCKRFYKPAGLDDLCAFLQDLDADEPLLWLGLGSNLLVRDGGFPGTVISTYGVLAELEWIDERTLSAGAGVSCSRVARMTAQQGLTGVEFLAGIPGTLGGALAMNAGAFGGETWPHVAEVVTVDRAGHLHTRLPSEYRIAYRNVSGRRDEWFVAARLVLAPGDAQAAQQRIRELLAERGAKQPTQQHSCGSVFRNPPDDFAARLIETTGLKGLSVGGAQVSKKHANFIVNTGSASAADIEALIEQVQERVELVHGVWLETEVHVVGEPVTAK